MKLPLIFSLLISLSLSLVADETADLIKRLGHSEFEKRQSASQKLWENQPLLNQSAALKNFYEETFKECWQHCLKLVELSPYSPHRLNYSAWLGACCDRELDLCLQWANRCVNLRDHAAYLDTLAEVYFRRKNLSDAVHFMRKAQKKEPHDSFFLNKLRRFEAALEQKEQSK